MFKNLLVLVATLCVTAVIAQEADPHSGAHTNVVGRKANAKVYHKIDESKLLPVGEDSHETLKKFSHELNEKSRKFIHSMVPKRKQELKHEHVANVDPAEISLASLESVSTQAVNKFMVQSRIYSDDSCGESNLSQASLTLANGCLAASDYSGVRSTTISALKVTTGGVVYGTAIQSFYSDSYCTVMLSEYTEISGPYMMDYCYSATTYSVKISASNSLPSEADGILLTDYQGKRACNTADFNGFKATTFLADGTCFSNDDGTSYMATCSGGSPYYTSYSDSSCSTVGVSLKLDDYDCYGSSTARYTCVTASST
jgi:hypothetical protein